MSPAARDTWERRRNLRIRKERNLDTCDDQHGGCLRSRSRGRPSFGKEGEDQPGASRGGESNRKRERVGESSPSLFRPIFSPGWLEQTWPSPLLPSATCSPSCCVLRSSSSSYGRWVVSYDDSFKGSPTGWSKHTHVQYRTHTHTRTVPHTHTTLMHAQIRRHEDEKDEMRVRNS